MENSKIVICSSCNKELEVSKKSRTNNVKCSSCRIKIQICNRCGREFKNSRKRSFCSIQCSGKNNFDIAREKLKSLDWSNINKKSYAEGKNYVGGGTTRWYQYNDIKVQGSYELRICKILDRMKELDEISSWEYTKDRIPYIDIDGSKRTYLLDFKVFNNDETFYYIEGKGYLTPTDFEKWKSAKQLGLDLRVWFKEELTKLENKYFISE